METLADFCCLFETIPPCSCILHFRPKPELWVQEALLLTSLSPSDSVSNCLTLADSLDLDVIRSALVSVAGVPMPLCAVVTTATVKQHASWSSVSHLTVIVLIVLTTFPRVMFYRTVNLNSCSTLSLFVRWKQVFSRMIHLICFCSLF